MSELFNLEQLNVLNQSIRGKKIKIEILNLSFKIVASIEGECNNGSIDISASTDNRRSCNLNLIVSSSYSNIITENFKIERGGLIWLNKLIKIYVGIDEIYNDKTVWFNQGVYLIDAPSYSYSLTDNSLSFNGIDLMSKLTSNRNGQLSNQITTIEAYTLDSENNITYTLLRNTIIAVINDYTDIENFFIADIPDTNKYLPEDVKFETGTTVYDILAKLLGYLPNWEMFFDVDGVFTIQPIPSGEEDTVYPLDEVNTSLEKISVDFGNVKNHIVVYGRTHGYKYYTEDASSSANVLNLVISEFSPSTLADDAIIKFKWGNYYNTSILDTVVISNGTNSYTYSLYNFEGKPTNSYIPVNLFNPDSLIVIRYNSFETNTPYFDFLSFEQAFSVAVDYNIDSPYYINADIDGINYYGGTTICSDGINYSVILNNTSVIGINEFPKGSHVTLMTNINNKINSVLTLYDGVNNNSVATGSIVIKGAGGSYVTLPADKVYNDGTIWDLIYDTWEVGGVETPCFLFNGRLQTLTLLNAGGEYDNIYSNELARQRAEYDLYLHSTLNNSINIETIPIYYLDVNKKIYYKDQISGAESYYLIKSLSIPLNASGDNMSINAMQIYN